MRRAQRGNSMIEFVLSATALMLILFGTIEFGLVLYTYHTVSNAARLGSRWAIVRGSACTQLDHCGASQEDIQTYVRSQIAALMDPNQVAVAATWAAPSCGSTSGCVAPTTPTGCGNLPGCVVSVQVTYPFNFALPYMSSAVVNLSSTSQMVISQ